MLTGDFQSVLEMWESKIKSIEKFQSEPLTETDTRCKIIDPIIFDILGWKQENVKMEPKVEAGYIDYFCESESNKFVIEAKRTNVLFNMPSSSGGYKTKILSKNKELFAAIAQARSYAQEKYCDFCVVSNGLNFAICKTYVTEEESDVYIINGKDSMRKNLHIIFEVMSPYKEGRKFFFENVFKNKAYRTPPQFSNVYKNSLYNVDKQIDTNKLASFLKNYMDKYFRNVDSNPELLNEVYCNTDKLGSYGLELRTYLRDRVPFFNSPVEEVVVEGLSAGSISRDYTLKFQANNNGHLFLLLGNLGAGKTTFIKRFYTKILDEPTRKKLVWINIDFMRYSSETSFSDFIYECIERYFRQDYKGFKINSLQVLEEIYKEEIVEKEDGGLWELLNDESKNQEKYNFFQSKQKNKFEHLANQIEYIRKKYANEVCLVFDNVDHHSVEKQMEICSFATEKATQLKSLIILSLRDETMWSMKSNLPSNAYNNTSYYQIIPPDVIEMIQKRINLVKKDVKNEKVYFDAIQSGQPMGITLKTKEVFETIENTIKNSQTKNLLEQISSGNMRYALEFFSDMNTSGHTNLIKLFKDLTFKDQPKMLNHWEVLKSIALGKYEIYNNDKSSVANLFQTFEDGFFSHFVLIRVLEKLNERKNEQFNTDVGKGYIPINSLLDSLQPYCISEPSLRQVLIPLLRSYLIDSDIGSRKHQDKNYYDKIKLVKLTPAGKYYIDELMGSFQYLEIILQDTPIHDHTILRELTDHIYFSKRETNRDQWERKFKIVEQFLAYLEKEENNDFSYFSSAGITKWGKIVPNIRSIYDKDKQRIMKQLSKHKVFN
ncbi:hypothetical protein [Paenibacillus hunanensis]|uniref:Recombinational DNA repair protein RecR n=1 Tax=Paenibacillus hunanensis TaxID=539262 RepID=A0ABU1IYU7_9BACL|nr:hypothetical protein [Paenibacillus hunanensis]MDR6243537.1 recombinational DNA repair protein RecR [Paenibacillus hunanensis]GGI98440.1 hypothetical protein GCM10008022_04010 [Paenibacillus hunanensis]